MRQIVAVAVMVAVATTGVLALQQRIVPSRQYDPGTRVFNVPPSVQKKYLRIEGRFTREAWPLGVNYTLEDGTVISNTALVVTFERTLDNGQTWLPAGAATFPGGVILRRDGTELLENAVSFGLTDPQGAPLAGDGDLRVTVTNLVTLTTGITITMTEPAN